MEFSRGKKILLGIGVIVVLISVWYLFFSYEGCDEVGCFNDNLEKCDKATFINQGNMTFEYKILGASTDSCEVNVKFLTGRLSESDLRQLENREMNCFIPKGVVSAPESIIFSSALSNSFLTSSLSFSYVILYPFVIIKSIVYQIFT